jgi:hypothetical protein
MVSTGNGNRLTLKVERSGQSLSIPLALPSGNRITGHGEGGRFFASNLSAMAKEIGNDWGLLQRTLEHTLRLACILYPHIDLASENASLLSAIGDQLPLENDAPSVPGRPGQYQKLTAQGPEQGELVITIQAIRQLKFPEWLSLPFPCGEMPQIPNDLFSAERPSDRLAEALSWEVPLIGSLTRDSLELTNFRKDWYTDLELEHFRHQEKTPTLATAYTFNDLKSRTPLPRIESPIALLSNAYGILLENVFMARYLKSIKDRQATSEGAFMKARSDSWALGLVRKIEASIPSARVLGYGTARLHCAVAAGSTDDLNDLAEFALEASAFAYRQDGTIHTPPAFEAMGTAQVFINLLRERNAEKLEIADQEIQNILTNTIN